MKCHAKNCTENVMLWRVTCADCDTQYLACRPMHLPMTCAVDTCRSPLPERDELCDPCARAGKIEVSTATWYCADCHQSTREDMGKPRAVCDRHKTLECRFHPKGQKKKKKQKKKKETDFEQLMREILALKKNLTFPVVTKCAKLRILSWNIQCLGGRFGQPEVRDDAVIEAIVALITSQDAHIVAVMEVLGSKGLAEIDRIHAGLKKVKQDWMYVTEGNGELTGSETYVFFYRSTDIAPEGQATYVKLDAQKKPLAFPTSRFRRPMQITFSLRGALKSPKVGTWKLAGVVFHAPSPAHGKDTDDAVSSLAKVPLLLDAKTAFIAADLNLPPETEEGVEARGFDELDKAGFLHWLESEHQQESTIRRKAILSIPAQDETFELDIDDSAFGDKERKALDDEMKKLVKGWDIDRVVPKTFATKDDYLQSWQTWVKQNGSAEIFVSACYDQLLVKSDPDDGGRLNHPRTKTISLLAAVTPPADSNGQGGMLYQQVKSLYKSTDTVSADEVLRVANRISDHNPLLMEADII